MPNPCQGLKSQNQEGFDVGFTFSLLREDANLLPFSMAVHTGHGLMLRLCAAIIIFTKAWILLPFAGVRVLMSINT